MLKGLLEAVWKSFPGVFGSISRVSPSQSRSSLPLSRLFTVVLPNVFDTARDTAIILALDFIKMLYFEYVKPL